MKKILTGWLFTVLLAVPCVHVCSQPSEGGIPPGISLNLSTGIPAVTMPGINVKSLLREDSIEEAEGSKPYRFGYDYAVNINPGNSGRWVTLKNNDKLWQVRIVCPGAISVNILFFEYEVSQGTKVFVYNADHSNILGAFTGKNNYDHRNLATGIIKGDDITIECLVPQSIKDYGKLNISRVTHGYKALPWIGYKKDFGGSGSCNININCPPGANWQDEKKAVAIIIDGGRACTGSLVNNTAQDGTPYFLTANHCFGGSVSGWAFMFNYESPGCPIIDGPTNQLVSGSTLKAKNAYSDFCLVQLSSPPQDLYSVYYLGWDHSGMQPSSQVCIHHPNGDVKKITFNNDTASAITWSGAQVWQIMTYDSGTTEPGSSGSPLFDQNHRVIGQLYGGNASCTNWTDDNFGRFNVSWDYGSTAATRLREWLDPLNTGVAAVNGFDPTIVTDSLDAGITSLSSPSGAYCSADTMPLILTIKNMGIDTLFSLQINYWIDSGNVTIYSWTDTLATLASQTVTIDTLIIPGGTHSVNIHLSMPNGSADVDSTNDDISATVQNIIGDNYLVRIKTDQYGSETTWVIKDSLGTNVFSGGPYADFSSATFNHPACLNNGCYQFIIYDAYGDGICCSSGNGYFMVLGPGGDTIGNGGQYLTSDTVPFCVSTPLATSFFSSDTSVCKKDSVQYYDFSNGSPTSWFWIFEGGTPPVSYSQSPLVFYDSIGVFDVTLIVFNSIDTDTLIMNNWISVGNCVTVQEKNNKLNNGIVFYPNPIMGDLGIRVWDLQFLNSEMKIYNPFGEEVLKSQILNPKSSVPMVLPSGIYFYRITSNSGQEFSGKLMVE